MTINSSDFNNEYNQLQSAFNGTTGHDHSGGTGLSQPIPLTTSVTGVLPVANGGTGVANGSNNTITLTGNYTLGITLTGNTSITLPTSGTFLTSSVATLSSLTSIGTIGTGVWQGSIVGAAYGGTGVANTGSTITVGGNFATAGAYPCTLTLSGSTNVSLPTSGTLVGTADTGSVSNTMLAGSITNAKLAGSITAAKLVLTDITSLSGLTTAAALVTTGTIATGTWQATKIGTVYGGTNADTSASTGVAQVSSGTWSISTALANGTTATKQSASDNSTKVATTSYVDSAVSANTGAVVLLHTINASAAASVVFNSTYITNTYNKYIIEYDGAYTAGGADDLVLTGSTDNGNSYIGSGYYADAVRVTGGTVSGVYDNNTANINITGHAGGLGTASTSPTSGTLKISNPSASALTNISFVTNVTGTSGYLYASGSGNIPGNTAINNLKIVSSDASALTGNFHLYGIVGT